MHRKRSNRRSKNLSQRSKKRWIDINPQPEPLVLANLEVLAILRQLARRLKYLVDYQPGKYSPEHKLLLEQLSRRIVEVAAEYKEGRG